MAEKLTEKQKIVIIGAGPAGLSAAYRILEKDRAKKFHVVILEAEKKVGGVSKTINHKGNRMDLGGHRFFTKEAEVEDFWRSLVKMPRRERISRIYFGNQFFDYPPRVDMKTIRKMGLSKTMKVGFSYLKSVFIKKPETSLENFYINRFGKQLYAMFFENYTEKLWGVHPSQISADWGAQRVKGLSIAKVIKNFVAPKSKKETSLIEEFEYPDYGPGQMYDALLKKIKAMGGEIILGAKVDHLLLNGKKIKTVTYTKNGKQEKVAVDKVISSMPIKDLVLGMEGDNADTFRVRVKRGNKVSLKNKNQSRGAVPEKVREIASELPYRDFRTVGILVKKTKQKLKDTWIYIQEPEVKMGRIQIFNNWSPKMVKDKKTVWLGLEYFCNEGEALWEMSDKQFFELASGELAKMGFIEKGDILDYHSEKAKKAYPAYFGSFKDFPVVRKFLDQISNLYLVGRNGQHRYNNMDHSIMTGFIAAEDVVNGIEDKSSLWAVNTEKEYHEEKKSGGKDVGIKVASLRQKAISRRQTMSDENQKNWLKRNLKYLIPFGIYLAISLTAILFHEVWEDEAQAWLMARDCTIPELIGRMQIEGHFLPWYFILMPFAKLGFPISPTINIISWLFTAVAAWLMLKKLPCKFYIRVLFIFTLPMIYFYPANARCYCLIPLATILLIMFYKDRFAKPLRYLLSLLLMLNTHIFCLGFVAVLAFEYLFDFLKLRKKFDRKQNQRIWLSIFGVLILAGLSVLPLMGSVGEESASGVHLKFTHLPSLSQLFDVFRQMVGKGFWFVPIEITLPLTAIFLIYLLICKRDVFLKITVSLLWQILIVIYLFALFLPTRAVIPYFIVLFFMLTERWREPRRYGEKTEKWITNIIKITIVVYFMFRIIMTGFISYSIICFIVIGLFGLPFCIRVLYIRKPQLMAKINKWKITGSNSQNKIALLSRQVDLIILYSLSVILLAIGCISSGIVIYKEITEPFSDAKSTSDFIKNNLENDALFLVDDTYDAMVSLSIVANTFDTKVKFYDLYNDQYFTFSTPNQEKQEYDLCEAFTKFRNYTGSIYYLDALIGESFDLKGANCSDFLTEIYESGEVNKENWFHASGEYFKIYKLDTAKL